MTIPILQYTSTKLPHPKTKKKKKKKKPEKPNIPRQPTYVSLKLPLITV
jgi:hypothetical protein